MAVVYFRAGYTPNDYPSEKEWTARQIIEESFSIKCPTIEYHLAGTKKIQQALAKPGILERFFPDPTDAKELRKCFAGLYPLDASPDGLNALDRGLSDPKNYVLKPQREGGGKKSIKTFVPPRLSILELIIFAIYKGNNFYGEDVKKKLETLSSKERNAYILMELIRPPKLENLLLRRGEVHSTEVLSELGIYGIWLSDGSKVYLNESGGHLLRTKTSSSNEGGVAAGFAVLDSPYLVS